MGFGGAIAADLTILRHAILSPIRQQTIELSKVLSHIVFGGLALLWVSGAMLVYLRVSADPHVLMNQKIWAKVVIVCILTINGIAVHRIALGHLVARRGRQLFDCKQPVHMGYLTFIAGVSSVSWIVPFALGVATEFNFKVTAIAVLGYYSCLVLLAWCAFLALARIVTSRNIALPVGLQAEGEMLTLQTVKVFPAQAVPNAMSKLEELIGDARFAWIHERRAGLQT
jgi:hypothetical protein